MMAISIDEGPGGFEYRTFDCPKCGNSEKQVTALDPAKSSAGLGSGKDQTEIGGSV